MEGIAVSLASVAGLGALMFALRSHITGGTVALVLVVPVVIGVVTGGTEAGIVAVLAGFFLYDLVFIPPYYTLRVGSARNWIALVVYVVVAVLIARVANQLRLAESEARNREADTQRLMQLSELLIEDRPLPELLPLVVSMVRDAFGCESVVLLLPNNDRLEVVARSGRALSPAELRRVSPEPGVAASLMPPSASTLKQTQDAAHTETIVLSAPGRPVGLLGLVGTQLNPHRRALARAFANHIGVAIGRAQLQQQAVRMNVLEEVDRLRGALVRAVSHDLRTPLATIKAAASTLLETGTTIAPSERSELLGLIDEQADRLARLVTNLLDMSRIEAGSLVVDRQPLDVGEVVTEAVAGMRPLVPAGRIVVRLQPGLPSVRADRVLMTQIIVNLLENALRYSPEGTAVEVTAVEGPATVEIAVTDSGPGLPELDGITIFGLARPSVQTPATPGATARANNSASVATATVCIPTSAARSAATPVGGTGTGLSIAKAFVEAHGGTIWAENLEGGGARVSFSLPVEGTVK